MTWSPWSGVHVRDLEMFAPNGSTTDSRLLQVEQIKVDPSWTSLMKGEKRFEKLEINGFLGSVSIEQLKEILMRYHEKHSAIVIKSASEQEPPVDEVLSPIVVQEKDLDHSSSPPVQPEKQAKTKEGEDKKETLVKSVVIDDFEGAVVLKNLNFHLYSENRPEIEMNLSGLSGDVPIWGRERDGELRIGNLEVGDYVADLKKELPIRWDGSSILIDESEVKLFGLDLEISAEVRIVKGFPFGLQVDLPNQQMDLSPIYSYRETPIEVGRLSSRNVFRGYLMNFGSLTGRSFTTFKDVVVHDPKDSGNTRFDHGSAALTLNSAGIVASDVRAIGAEDSVLMNGFVTRGGDAAATVRIVSSPGRAASHENRVKSTSPALSLEFSPLVTPDREYRDVRIESRSGTLEMDIGVDRKWVPLLPTVRAFLGSPKPSKPQLP